MNALVHAQKGDCIITNVRLLFTFLFIPRPLHKGDKYIYISQISMPALVLSLILFILSQDHFHFLELETTGWGGFFKCFVEN